MGTGVTEITMEQLASLGRYNNVLFFNDPSDTDLLKTIVGHPRTVLVNLGQFLNIASGEIQGDALAADEVGAAQIGAAAVDTSELADAGVTDAKLASSLAKDTGTYATGVLRASGNYADGETIVIGTDTYEIDPIQTDLGDDTQGGEWNNITDPLTVAITVGNYANLNGTFVVGDLILITNEYLRVTVIDGDNITFERGAGGSTVAAHGDAVNILTSAGTPAPTKVPVGIAADLTAAVVTPILAATINEDAGAAGQSNDVSALSMDSGATLFITADAVGAVVLATTETGGNLAWDATAMRNGAAETVRSIFRTALVPDSEEVTANIILVPMPFDPTMVQVFMVTTSTGAIVEYAGDVQIVVASAPMPAYLLLNNDGATNFSGNETVHILAIS